MDGHSTVRFPGESASYRAARDELLAAERDLRKQVEQVAQLRRKLPLGRELPEDYAFEEGAADLADTTAVVSVKLSDLFRKGIDTLALYNFTRRPARSTRQLAARPPGGCSRTESLNCARELFRAIADELHSKWRPA